MLSRSVLERLEVRSWKLHLGNSDLRHWLERRVRNWDGRHKGGVEIGIEEVTSWSGIPNGLMIVSLLFQSHTLFWFRHHGLIQCVCVCVWGLKVYFSFCQCVISPLCVCMCEEKKCVLAGVSTDGSVFCCLVCIHVNCLQHWRVCAFFFFFPPSRLQYLCLRSWQEVGALHTRLGVNTINTFCAFVAPVVPFGNGGAEREETRKRIRKKLIYR